MAVISCFAKCAGGKEKDPSAEADELEAICKEEKELMEDLACLPSASEDTSSPSMDSNSPTDSNSSTSSSSPSDTSSPVGARVPLKKDRHLVHRLKRTEKHLLQLKKKRDALQRAEKWRQVYGNLADRLKASVVQLYHAAVANIPVLIKCFMLIFFGLSGHPNIHP